MPAKQKHGSAGRKLSTRRASSVSRHLLVGFVVELVLVGYLLVRAFSFSVPAGLFGAVTVVIFVRMFLALLSFLIAALLGDGARRTPLGFAGRTRQIWWELMAVLRLFFFLHPLEPWLSRREPPADAVLKGPPILFVHGFFSNGGFWWSMERRLRRAGFTNLYSLNLEPAFGDIDCYAEQLDARIREIREHAQVANLILVAHSMGGLVCRAYLRDFGNHLIAKVITLGSPHAGTFLAWLLPGINLRQMRPGSEWLAGLDACRTGVDTVSIFSDHDNIVVPQCSAHLSGARNVQIPGIGHLAMAFAPEILAALTREIADADS